VTGSVRNSLGWVVWGGGVWGGGGGGGDEDPFGDGFDDFDDAPTVISDVVSLPTSDGMGHAGMWA